MLNMAGAVRIIKPTTLLVTVVTLIVASACELRSEPNRIQHRLIVLADMGNEPDEEQQMVHMFMYANEIDVEGLIAVTGKYLKGEPRPDLFHGLIDGYEQVVPNLRKHAQGWPEADSLRDRVKTGQLNYGIADVGEGKTSPGSEYIIEVVERDDPRPVNIAINAGSNTLAQALFDYRNTHTDKEVEDFVAKLRVYENGAQDDAGAWILHKFPSIHWLRSNMQTYGYMGGGGGGGPYCWEPYANDKFGQKAWTYEHIKENHGVLGTLYRDRGGSLEGGGTTPWIGLVNKGLYDPDHQAWGGWGGRFSREKKLNVMSRHKRDVQPVEENYTPFYCYDAVSDTWTDPVYGDTYDRVETPVWRFRRAMLEDFQGRMDWCVASYENANHNPVAAINGDRSDQIIEMYARPGSTVQLDASDSRDPDGDVLDYHWYIYPEAGTYTGNVSIGNAGEPSVTVDIPSDAEGTEIHCVLDLSDQNSIVSMHDYRRVVITVSSNTGANLSLRAGQRRQAQGYGLVIAPRQRSQGGFLLNGAVIPQRTHSEQSGFGSDPVRLIINGQR